MQRVLDSDSGGEDAVEETGEALSKKFKAMKVNIKGICNSVFVW